MRRERLISGLITGAALAAATLAGAIAPAAAAPAARPAATGSDELSSISCTSTHYCIAVGTARISRVGAGNSIALACDGRGWEVLPTHAARLNGGGGGEGPRRAGEPRQRLVLARGRLAGAAPARHRPGGQQPGRS